MSTDAPAAAADAAAGIVPTEAKPQNVSILDQPELAEDSLIALLRGNPRLQRPLRGQCVLEPRAQKVSRVWRLLLRQEGRAQPFPCPSMG